MSEDTGDVFENAQMLKDFIEANLSISFSIEDDNPKKFTLEKINPRAVFAICSVLLNSKDRLERLESERALMVDGLEYYAESPMAFKEGDRTWFLSDPQKVARDILEKIQKPDLTENHIKNGLKDLKDRNK